jgi:hypothetical protein
MLLEVAVRVLVESSSVPLDRVADRTRMSRQHECGEVTEVAGQGELVTDRIPVTGVEGRRRLARTAFRSSLPVGSLIARLASRYAPQCKAAGDRARP